VVMMVAQQSLENTVWNSPMGELTTIILVLRRITLGVQPALTAMAPILHGPIVVLVTPMEMSAPFPLSTVELNTMDAHKTHTMDGVQPVSMPTQMNTTPTECVPLRTILISMMVLLRLHGTMGVMELIQLSLENTVFQ